MNHIFYASSVLFTALKDVDCDGCKNSILKSQEGKPFGNYTFCAKLLINDIYVVGIVGCETGKVEFLTEDECNNKFQETDDKICVCDHLVYTPVQLGAESQYNIGCTGNSTKC